MAILHDSDGAVLNTLRPSTLVQVSNPAVNTGATITLPAAGTGLFHYITALRISRNATAALAGTAQLQITTTNLNGLTVEVGNAMAAGGTQIDWSEAFGMNPLRSATANTATTIVLPAPGAAVRWGVLVLYFAAT